MAFEKGDAGGPGRPPGTPNKSTAEVKAALEACFDGLGGIQALQDWATLNPTEFYKLWGKLIPKDLKVSTDSGPIRIIVQTGVPLPESAKETDGPGH